MESVSVTMDIAQFQPSSEEETAASKEEKVQALSPNPFLSPMVAELIGRYCCKRTLFSLRQVSKLYYSITSKLCWNKHAKEFVVDFGFTVPPSDFPAHIYRELSLRIPSKLHYHDTLRNPGRNFIVRIAPFIIELTIGISEATYSQTNTRILQNLNNIKVLNVFVSNERFLRPNMGPIVRVLGHGVQELFIFGQTQMIADSALQYLFQDFLQEFGHVIKVGLTGCNVREPRTLDLLAGNVSRITRMGLVLRRDDVLFTTPDLQHRLEILSPVVEILGLVQPDEMRHVPWPIFPIENAKWQMLKFILLTNWSSPLTFLREFPCLERINLTDTNYATSLFINPELPDHENVISIFGNLPGPPKKVLHLRHFDRDCEFHRFKNKEIIDFLNGNFDFTVWLSWFVEAVMIEAMEEDSSEWDVDFSSSSMSSLLSPSESEVD